MLDWGALLKPPAKVVLALLLDGPKTLSDLAARTALAKPSLLRHLNALEALGVLSKEEMRTPVGREVQYALKEVSVRLDVRPGFGAIVSWASTGHQDPVFPLTAQIADEKRRGDVTSALHGIRGSYGDRFDEDVGFILLFGSYARGEATWKSDIDLMLLLHHDAPATREALRDAVADAQEAVENPIRAHFSTPENLIEGTSPLHRDIVQEGVVVFGPWKENEVWRKLARYKSISF